MSDQGFKGKDLISIRDFSKKQILQILERAAERKKGDRSKTLSGKLVGSCFFEPSTRTRLSFESAVIRLGGSVTGFSQPDSTSAKKGESLFDTIRVIGSYVDLIVMRHPLEGSARLAADATPTPVINGGDGANEHPTQTLLDLFTILEAHGTLEGLSIAFVGDLKYGRTVHSLALALKEFGGRLYFVSPGNLQMPENILAPLKEKGIPFSCHESISDVIKKVDVLYMTRIQEERFTDKGEYEEIKKHYRLSVENLKGVKPSMKIMHPLPRVFEIDPRVDETPHALYFTQAENGLYVREALLELILG